MKRFIALLIAVILSLTLAACESAPATVFEGEKLSYTEMTNGDGSIAKRWYYKYYAEGEISTSMRCMEDGTCVQRNEYTYNDDGLKETETIYLLGNKASYTEYSYTDDGKILKEKVYLPAEITETIYYYNPDGTENYVEKLDSENKIVSIKRCIYDEAGNKIKERFFDGYENYTGGIEYTYEGNVLTVKEYIGIASDEFSKEEYTYDGENVVKTVLYDKSGKHIYTDTADYDGDRCMHRMRVDANNSIVYTWDAHYDSFVSLIG